MSESVPLRVSPRLPARALAGWIVLAALCLAPNASAATKVKLHGYVTSRADSTTVMILDDRLELSSGSRVLAKDEAGEHSLNPEDLAPGMFVEAEGQWLDKHKFFAEKITVDLRQDDKRIRGTAYLQEDPADAAKIASGEPSELKVDGYWLQIDQNTKRDWNPARAGTKASVGETGSASPMLAGYHVKYVGLRRKDGRITAEEVQLGPPGPSDAYKIPHNLGIVRGKDAQTGIDTLEFRDTKKVQGRMKLLAERGVQEYVSHLGDSLIPKGAEGTSRPIEFRFFVVEDPEINASSFPDGTLLINTGLLGALENEAQLAFVLSHEMAHVLQTHYRREVEETRGSRIGLTIAGLAAGAFIGDAGIFMSQIGIASVVNGHQRELENQADRLGLQNVIEHGYDPREAPNFSRIVINRYGDRTTSRLWSNHDSSVIRGSFLTIQLMKEYPEGHWDGTKKNTAAFQSMKEDLGPVKIM
jgi:peptidase M48-like protein